VVLWLLKLLMEGAMGTVGLSFGSPTSGTGFNVSSTVAEIVGNLQNVETPWKNQLTSLESQDTAISSLGTLFSNLSNDLSSLTDFNGILSEKTGSSSDTNVLTLTAANTTAVAGTHTVTVTSLAQTSSGYMAPITDASDALSGSVTLQVGSGTAQTITVPTSSGNNTLSGLASTINSSGIGITASVLTDSSGSRLSLVSGTSGADGNITVSANSIVAANTQLNYSGTAGSGSAHSTGTLTSITNAGDTLSGSLSIQMGNGTTENVVIGAVPSGGAAANTIYTGSGVNTLSGLEGVITANTATLGVTASVITNSDGSSSLSLLSNTSGTAGTLTVASSIIDSSNSLGYTSTVNGSDAQLSVDGVNLTSASNTVANLIPGVTFQLLAPSATETGGGLEQIQVVIGNDNTDVESTVNQFVTDYNSLISAVNTQEGNTSSGTPEPLFGSPTLSLLQQQLMNGLNEPSPNGSLTSVPTNTNATLSGSLSITVGSGAAQTINIGAGTDTSNTFYTGSGVNTLSGLASAINAANIGVTAGVVTTDGESTMTLTSQTAGPSGGLAVASSIDATGYTPLSYSGTNATKTQNSTGTLTGIPSLSDLLAGSITIQVGSNTSQTIDVPPNSATSPSNTLSGLAGAINSAQMGVTATVTTTDGVSTLSLLSNTPGSAGNLSVSANLMDTTNLTSTPLSYTNSSDINSLTSLGISVNNDGSLTFDAASLDSLLNSDYSSVAGFFQNANSWGQTFSTMLTNAGSSSPTGVLALASSSNSNIESTLNADISKENIMISAQQSSLTTELNQANQVMQQLPSMLDQVNELYSAITGYNQQTNG
jgi:flagellar hook-associated protein 2